MATNKRTYPNNYFAWYNDDKRVAILSIDTETTVSERTKEAYDTWQGTGDLSGTISAFADYSGTQSGTVKAICSASHGLETNDRVTLASSPDAYYDGNYQITKIDADEFYFTKAYSAEDNGTFTSLFIDNGLRITYHSKYEEIKTNNLGEELSPIHGVDSGMQQALVCYVKARLYEDQGDMQKAQYFRAMYNKQVKEYPSRKSGVRRLAVPRL